MSRFFDPPYHSVMPADWFMYCDLLQDAGASKSTWQRALRIARSLECDPALVLAGIHGGRSSLGFHPPNNLTAYIYHCWLRPEWVRARGLAPQYMMHYAGIPDLSSANVGDALSLVDRERCVRQFFQVHSMRKYSRRVIWLGKF